MLIVIHGIFREWRLRAIPTSRKDNLAYWVSPHLLQQLFHHLRSMLGWTPPLFIFKMFFRLVYIIFVQYIANVTQRK